MTALRSNLAICAGYCLSLGRICSRFGLAVLTATCTSTSGQDQLTPLTHVEAGTHSALAERTFLVIEGKEDFALWYRDLQAHRLPPPPVPQIDFRQHLALAASMGHQPSGGYGIRIAGAAIDGDTIKVTIVERQPASGTAQITVVTSPYAIATVPRSEVTKVAFVGAGGQTLAVRKVDRLGRE